MAKFFVGQRVKFVGRALPFLNPVTRRLVGTEGRIVGPATNASCDWHVRLDHDVWDIDAPSDYLEPIIDKPQPCDAEFKQSLDDLLKRTERTNIRI